MSKVDWDLIDWNRLEALRKVYLEENFKGDYWSSDQDLRDYDLTFARRIAWKWEAVFQELKRKSYIPEAAHILDWGCGTGVATECYLENFPQVTPQKISVFDHSARAESFTIKKIQTLSAESKVGVWERTEIPDLLLISHVLNELKGSQVDQLLSLVERVPVVIWVEPGLMLAGRRLPELRERLRKTFEVMAPCTHQSRCGLLAKGNEKHWCHHFAQPPSEIFADPDWVRFGKSMKIDLRSLPYSFLALKKLSLKAPQEDYSRIIGRPREYKGYSKILSCDKVAVRELILQKRDAPEIFKTLKKLNSAPLFKWELQGEKIVSGDEHD